MTQKYGRDSNAYWPWRLDSEPCLNRSPKVQFIWEPIESHRRAGIANTTLFTFQSVVRRIDLIFRFGVSFALHPNRERNVIAFGQLITKLINYQRVLVLIAQPDFSFEDNSFTGKRLT